LWRYAVASARVVFGQVHDPLFERIVAVVHERPGLTRTALHKHLGWKLGSAELVAALSRVQSAGAIHRERIETGGRPAERWMPGPAPREEKQEKGEKPAAEVAADPFPPFSSFPTAPLAEPAAPPPAWNPDHLAPGSYTL
jgi:hypothetical protein